MTATRVLWVVKGLGRGGAERLLTLTAPRIDPSRFEVEIVYLLADADGFVAELEDTGIPVRCLEATGTVAAGWPRRLRTVLRQGRYDLVHTHSPVPAVAARALAPRSARFIHTEHNVWDVYRWPTFAANALTYARNDAVIAVSDRVAESIAPPRWARFGPPPDVETLLHGVALEMVARGRAARARARDRIGLGDSTPVIGKVANLSPKKDHLGVLYALDLVRRDVDGVVLLLIGSGPLESELRAAVEARGLDENVRFLGSRDDVTELLPALDVFVLGSRYEGLPISLLEAMAAQVACVATRVGGIPEVIRDGQGRLVPPGDPLALARAVTGLLLDPVERASIAHAGRLRVEEAFSIGRAVRRTEELYAQVLDRAATRPS